MSPRFLFRSRFSMKQNPKSRTNAYVKNRKALEQDQYLRYQSLLQMNGIYYTPQVVFKALMIRYFSTILETTIAIIIENAVVRIKALKLMAEAFRPRCNVFDLCRIMSKWFCSFECNQWCFEYNQYCESIFEERVPTMNPYFEPRSVLAKLHSCL